MNQAYMTCKCLLSVDISKAQKVGGFPDIYNSRLKSSVYFLNMWRCLPMYCRGFYLEPPELNRKMTIHLIEYQDPTLFLSSFPVFKGNIWSFSDFFNIYPVRLHSWISQTSHISVWTTMERAKQYVASVKSWNRAYCLSKRFPSSSILRLIS